MRTHITRLAALGAAAIMGAGIVSAIPAAGTTGSPRTTHIAIFDIDRGYTKFVDLGDPGMSPGDVIVENHKEVDAVTGNPVGSAITRVTIIRVYHNSGDLMGMIDCTIVLKHGLIQFSGGFRFSELEGGAVVPVVGGTGAYDSAGGQVVATAGELNGKAGTYLTFDLTP